MQADFSGDRWIANLGVRVVHTDTTAAPPKRAPTSLWTPSHGGLDPDLERAIREHVQPSDRTANYTLPLPSANFTYWAIPDRLQLRARGRRDHVAARSEPAGADLVPTMPINGQPQLYYNGTAGLKPIKANQAGSVGRVVLPPAFRADASRCSARRSTTTSTPATAANVNLGTIAVRGRTAGNRCAYAVPVDRARPGQRRARATSTGVELAWQHILDNGFGTHMQYTPTWTTQLRSVRQLDPGPINAAPPTTVPTGLFYDKGPLQRRRQLGPRREFPVLLLAVHGGPGLAGDHESVPRTTGIGSLVASTLANLWPISRIDGRRFWIVSAPMWRKSSNT